MSTLLFNDETPTQETIEQPAQALPAPETPPAKKDGRGRPRKNPAAAPAKPAASVGDDEEALKAKLSDFKQADEQPAPAGAETQPAAPKIPPIIISGAVFLSMIDFICPRLIMFVYSFIDDRTKYIVVQDLKLSKQQIADLEPVAGEVSKVVFSEINPIVAFGMMLGVSYFANMEEALINADTKAAKIREAENKTQPIPEL